ncbi:MAG TPA: TetR family transcriptional regulator, partial [Kofleriaceae bacterium]
MPKTREQAKAQTRIALIDAGIIELGHHGLDASLDQICARAKLTRGAFYVHFADRDAFIVAVMHHVLGGF